MRDRTQILLRSSSAWCILSWLLDSLYSSQSDASQTHNCRVITICRGSCILRYNSKQDITPNLTRRYTRHSCLVVILLSGTIPLWIVCDDITKYNHYIVRKGNYSRVGIIEIIAPLSWVPNPLSTFLQHLRGIDELITHCLNHHLPSINVNFLRPVSFYDIHVHYLPYQYGDGKFSNIRRMLILACLSKQREHLT